MNIFKKIFRTKNQTGNISGNKEPDIDRLINSADSNASIIELDDYVSELCEYGERLDLGTEPQKNFYYNQNLEREVNNGGFYQYYYNSSGDFAHETIDSLKAIGANKTAEIVKIANDQFPEMKVPKDRVERQNILDQIKEKADEIWEELTQKFFKYEDDLNSLNMNYIKKNIRDFE